MSEHFAFEQGLRDTAQVHFHERFLRSWTVAVYSLGYQLLTRSAFSGNQYGGIGTADALDGFQDIHQCLALSDDMAPVEIISFLFLLFGFSLVVQFEGRFDA